MAFYDFDYYRDRNYYSKFIIRETPIKCEVDFDCSNNIINAREHGAFIMLVFGNNQSSYDHRIDSGAYRSE